MKILAINASPHRDKGNTALILNPFLDGMREEGAEVEVLYTMKMDIKPCLGCLKCWTRTPGACIQKDDMKEVLPRIKAADVMVFATPLYWDGVSGPMKMFMDRMTPLGQPFIIMREGRDRHPVREGYGHGKIVVVSTCGYFGIENFDAMITHYKAVAINLEREFAGALLRPNAQSIQPMMMMGMGDQFTEIFAAAKRAGTELARNGEMQEATLSVIGRDIMDVGTFMNNANKYFTKVLEDLKK
ncbi:MAG: flavodoxin family protein [Deltaproteobacteria bacterium]|nr:flavodoxin family protein [Deltaproteobacteria bacterium]